MPAVHGEAQALIQDMTLRGLPPEDQTAKIVEAITVVLSELADQGAVDWASLVISTSKPRQHPYQILFHANAVVMAGASRGTR